MSYFTNDLGAIRNAVGSAVISAFDAIFMSIMVILKMLLYVDIKLTLLSVIPLIIILVGGIYYGDIIERRFDKKQEAFSKMSDQVQESISGIRVIKAFIQEKAELKAFARINEENREKNMSVVRILAFMMPFLNFLIGISGVICMLYGGKMVVEGTLTPGKFVAFISYINMLVWPMLAMGDSISSFSQGLASMKRIGSIFLEEAEVCDTAKTDNRIKSLNGGIEIRNLDFRYKEGLPETLKNVSVNIPAGTSLAIIGHTGCGKTTIANLLLHMYNVEDGSIFFDGRDINTIPLNVLRKQISYVPQDNFLFSDTLQTNIAFGKREFREMPKNKKLDRKLVLNSAESVEAYIEKELEERENLADKVYNDLEDVKKAAKSACIHDNIMDFPKAYSTMVGERGVGKKGIYEGMGERIVDGDVSENIKSKTMY